MTTEEGNKLIMVFDGWRLETRYTFDPDHNGGKNEYQVYVKDTPMGTVTCRPEDVVFDIVYHQSWDALMPVVEKINNDGKFEIVIECSGNSTNRIVRCHIVGLAWKGGYPDNEEICARSSARHSLIQIVFVTVVEFIQWYNEQPKS